MKVLVVFLVAVSPAFGLPNIMQFRDYEIGQCIHTICCELYESEVFQESIKDYDEETTDYLKDVIFKVLGINQSDITMASWKDLEKRICAFPEETKVELYDKFCQSLNTYWSRKCLFNPTYDYCIVMEKSVVTTILKMTEYSSTGRCVYDPQKAQEYGKSTKEDKKPLFSLPSFG